MEPYASLLATAAYPPEAVEAALAAITVPEQLERARGLAQKEAMQATENRDRAMRDLRRMVRPLRAQMRTVLRRPDKAPPGAFVHLNKQGTNPGSVQVPGLCWGGQGPSWGSAILR